VPPSAGTGRSITVDSWAGVRAALASPTLRPLLLLTWLPPMFAVVSDALAVPYARQIDAPDYAIRLLFGAVATGSVLGAIAVRTWLSAAARERLILPLALVQTAPLLVFALEPSLIPATGLLLVVGVGMAHVLGVDQRLLAALDDGNRGLVLWSTPRA
jgi:hypothetical protein